MHGIWNLLLVRMGTVTTVELCLPIIRLLKYAGLFPCSIAHRPQSAKCTNQKPPVYRLKISWKSFLLRATVQTYYAIRLGFYCIQLFRATVLNDNYKFCPRSSPLSRPQSPRDKRIWNHGRSESETEPNFSSPQPVGRNWNGNWLVDGNAYIPSFFLNKQVCIIIDVPLLNFQIRNRKWRS